MTSPNCLIGSWNFANRLKKEELIKFVGGHKNIQFQQGSLNASVSHDHSRYWEYATALAFTQPKGKSVLDAGGANSVLTWYLGSIGANVTSIDLLKKNVDFGNQNNKLFGFDNVKHVLCDASLVKKGVFDYVYCINVIEHVMEHARPNFRPGVSTYWNKRYNPSDKEVAAEKAFVSGLSNALKPGGILVITYDYKTFGRYRCQPKCAYMRSPEDVEERIIKTSGLNVFGEAPDFTEDLEKGPRSQSTGILFLEKSDEA